VDLPDLAHVIGQIPEDEVRLIYVLLDDGKPFYVGSTSHLRSRFRHHQRGSTLNTKAYVAGMKRSGRALTFQVIDVAAKGDHLKIEAKWIDAIPGLINDSPMGKHLSAYKRNPKKFRCYSDGTLTLRI
jgi:predicted GIY-YIG superfamily endonuclease